MTQTVSNHGEEEEEQLQQLSIKPLTALGCHGILCCVSAETMVVMVIWMSLALLVCAIIPVIFYIHWRSSSSACTYCFWGFSELI